jgi:hypothetical protein
MAMASPLFGVVVSDAISSGDDPDGPPDREAGGCFARGRLPAGPYAGGTDASSAAAAVPGRRTRLRGAGDADGAILVSGGRRE